MSRIGLVVVLASLAAAVGCGKSEEEKLFERIAQQCNEAAATGLTPGLAQQAFGAGSYIPPIVDGCVNDVAAIGGPRDQCAPATEDPHCRIYFYYFPSDPDLQEPTGACLRCELRVNESDIPESGIADAPVCAGRFQRGVCCAGLEPC